MNKDWLDWKDWKDWLYLVNFYIKAYHTYTYIHPLISSQPKRKCTWYSASLSEGALSKCWRAPLLRTIWKTSSYHLIQWVGMNTAYYLGGLCRVCEKTLSHFHVFLFIIQFCEITQQHLNWWVLNIPGK